MAGITKPGRAALVLLIVATTLLAALPAQAAVDSHISAAYDASTEHFHGKVTSASSECVAHRTVKLFQETSSGNQLVGKTSSTGSGRWSIEVMHADGKYFARIPAEKEMTTRCGGARSKNVDVM